jgi:hypothetical protein
MLAVGLFLTPSCHSLVPLSNIFLQQFTKECLKLAEAGTQIDSYKILAAGRTPTIFKIFLLFWPKHFAAGKKISIF